MLPPDNPNNIGLTFSPKNQLPQFGRWEIFSVSLKSQVSKLTENVKKLFVAVLLRFIYIMTALLDHSKLISCSTGPTDLNFRENKKIIMLISSQNKK